MSARASVEADRQCYPETLSLVDHRLHRLRSGNIALLAERSTGWCILSPTAYNTLDALLDDGRCSPELQPFIDQLWTSGLLLRDGIPHPATQRLQQDVPSSLLLKLTGACNFACTYCYDYDTKRFSANLSFERITEVINHLLNRREDLAIVFHGGEPLLRFTLLKKVVEYAVERSGDRNRLRFALQTNGALLTTEVIRFLEAEKFSVGISMDSLNDDGNSLRILHNGKGTTELFTTLLKTYGEFVRNHCGVLAVLSRRSAPLLPQFISYLQEQGIKGLTVSFLDLTGRARDLSCEKLTPDEAVDTYRNMIEMIRSGRVHALGLRSVISRVENLFTFQPRDFCHRGPCAAADEFLVLDAEGVLRSCDCVYDDQFVLSDQNQKLISIETDPARTFITQRHSDLRSRGSCCSTCSLFGLCGGTCAAKAIANSGSLTSVDELECAVVRYLYPELLEEFDQTGEKPILDYYYRHRLAGVSDKL